MGRIFSSLYVNHENEETYLAPCILHKYRKWLKSCTLTLNRPDGVYFIDDIIFAHLVVETIRPVFNVKLKASIKGMLAYYEYRTHTGVLELTKHYISYLVYESTTSLKTDQKEERFFSRGKNHFEFNLPVRAQCPPSFGCSTDFPHLCYCVSVFINLCTSAYSGFTNMGWELLASLPIHIYTRNTKPITHLASSPSAIFMAKCVDGKLLIRTDKKRYEAPERITLYYKFYNLNEVTKMSVCLLQQIYVGKSMLERPYAKSVLNMDQLMDKGSVSLTLPGFHLQPTEERRIRGNIMINISYVVEGILTDVDGNIILKFKLPVEIANFPENTTNLIKALET
ncbi:hypothetical protein GJ496_000564 [Pomphorhynchus laevis]|nr:hypothetical protein GJ496_000564 [Pomphorhynchus laevis]